MGGEDFEFFKSFKQNLTFEVKQEKKKIESKLPSNAQYLKMLVINSGYFSSYEAIDKARKIPDKTRRQYLSKKCNEEQSALKLRTVLKN